MVAQRPQCLHCHRHFLDRDFALGGSLDPIADDFVALFGADRNDGAESLVPFGPAFLQDFVIRQCRVGYGEFDAVHRADVQRLAGQAAFEQVHRCVVGRLH
jgi:hypothetical protein